MEIFDVFSMNGIENYPAADEIFLKMLFLRGDGAMPLGGCKVPCHWSSGPTYSYTPDFDYIFYS